MLKGKTVLITGSTTGIGKATAKYCAEMGAKVMIHGRNKDRAKEVCDEIGHNTQFVIAELDDVDAPKKIIDATIDAYGEINGLVNNAGIYPRNDIHTATVEDFNRIMAINLQAPLFISQQAVKHFLKQGGGAIVNIGSINAYCGQNDLLIYSASKGGLMTLTRNLAESLGTKNIRVNQINAGWTVTETEKETLMKTGLPEDFHTQVSPLFAPTRKLYVPEQVAPHVAFWLSELSAPATGQVYETEQYPVIGRNHINRLTFYQDLT